MTDQARTRRPREFEAKGLKEGSVGFWDGVAIGVDSTAPAYTIAAVLGSIAIIAGTKAPAVLIVSFIPMLFIAGAFSYMNRADPDCGTTFSWVSRAMGPWMGWMGDPLDRCPGHRRASSGSWSRSRSAPSSSSSSSPSSR